MPNQPGLRIDACTSRYLTAELESIKPKVIVPVGEVAMNAVLKDVPGGVTNCRGYVFHQPDGSVVVPIVHPSFVARGNREYWAITVADLKKIKSLAEGRLARPLPECFSLFPTIKEIKEFTEMILRKQLKFAFDLGWDSDLKKKGLRRQGHRAFQ
jgi:hypothetical protein